TCSARRLDAAIQSTQRTVGRGDAPRVHVPAQLGALTTALHALRRPALLLAGIDAVVANRAAEQHVVAALAWDRAGRPPGYADAATLLEDTIRVDLVLPHPGPRCALPPSLQRVGALLGEGLPDKEIAVRL